MADFDVPTHEELIDDVASHFETEISGSSPRLRATDEYAIAHAQAGLVKGLYGHQTHIAKQIHASTANESNFWRHAADDGIFRKAATKSVQTYRFTGVNTTVIPEGTIVERSDGVEYATTAEGTIASGIADVEIEAVEPGALANNEDGQQLTLTESIVDIQDIGTVQATITSGTDQETHAEGLERYLQHIRTPPSGGGPGDYERWVLEIAGVTRAWQFGNLEGPNTVSIAFVRDNEDPITPDSTERTAAVDYIDENYTPITVTLYAIELAEQEIDITFSALSPNTAGVLAAISEAVTDLFHREGGPDKTVYLDDIKSAIRGAGVVSYTLTSPSADVVSTTTQVPVVGTVSVA